MMWTPLDSFTDAFAGSFFRAADALSYVITGGWRFDLQ